MKFKRDFTEANYRILAIFGPDAWGEYAGVVQSEHGTVACNWDASGMDVDHPNIGFDLKQETV